MRYRTLGNTGLTVPILGFGAATLGDEYGKADAAEAARAVHMAIDLGMNFFDVAPYYGRTLGETRLGEALKGRRHEALISTKCARYDIAGFDFTAQRAFRSIDESLERLQTDYIDVFHIHDVEFGDEEVIVNETLPALRKIQESGKARYIGITGLSLTMLRRIAERAPVDCMLSYARYDLLNVDLDEILTPFARERGIGLISASPLHMRLLANADPPPWHPAPQSIRDAARAIVDLCGHRGVDPAALALQFAVRNPDVACTFNGITNCAELQNNLQAIESEPDADLLRQIEDIARPVKRRIWATGRPENQDPMVVAA